MQDTLILQDTFSVGDSPAISVPGQRSLNYSDFRELQIRTHRDLERCGVAATDRVAIVLPNGPAMASCFLSVASSTASAPLNPAYREAEFEFYLSDLDPKALIVRAEQKSVVRDIATRLGIRVLELVEESDGIAGQFTLNYSSSRNDTRIRAATSGDTALVLHTSGTTSRPKMVPLSHANLLASARHIAATLELNSDDRCLNVMPLFHIHGLVAAVLSTICVGGEVFCMPDFNVSRFFTWIDAAKPTWYTAVPTMHQMILDRSGRNLESITQNQLRFIRSSSASLPIPVMHALEKCFGCPVIESYGMTEACHQMTSNPLPPALRKDGSVGLPAGPEVRVMTEAGSFAASGVTGEVVIRGPNVTEGYAKNPDANDAGFADDPGNGAPWFRTGDLGTFDADGYLQINGRIKEIINRGGEKISPKEIDDVLMDHPAVKQAVTFALPHPKLGEDVAVAIVREDSGMINEPELRKFARERLIDFKVPKTVCFVEEIPKGSTGKLQRIGLAEKLGLV